MAEALSCMDYTRLCIMNHRITEDGNAKKGSAHDSFCTSEQQAVNMALLNIEKLRWELLDRSNPLLRDLYEVCDWQGTFQSDRIETTSVATPAKAMLVQDVLLSIIKLDLSLLLLVLPTASSQSPNHADNPVKAWNRCWRSSGVP